ncbi:uncharacterized protein FOMMEDRAFT_157901 [Fomitiporia mediterranea MF3/22]|uniref:uncharacterized protein n=1 Tax=Fomitiporia mediterranea (strain MF3/22) TaxID=694068 RepID=UPI00044096C7|nr:uncharacterized protein FOMMEDRAFT_157901 [Fomitiporia mediterranea MF3/22]EJD00794.1 hypothetical protein FOMMEDRAFT_157901 [Fomitiporia mediterranea MF3/22]
MSAGGAITTTGARPVVPPINTTNLPPPAPPIPNFHNANRGAGGALGNKPVPPPPPKSPLRASSRATTREQYQERAALGRTRSGSAGSTSSSISRRRGDGKVIQLTMPTPLSALDPPTPTRAEQIPSPTSLGQGQAQLASMLEKTRKARDTTTGGTGGPGNLYPPPASPLNIKKKAPQRPGTGNSNGNIIRRESSFSKLGKRLTRKPSMAFTGLNLQRMGMGRKRSSNGSGGGYKRSGISSEDVFRNLDRSQGERGQGQSGDVGGDDDNVPLQTLQQQRQSGGLTRRLSKKKQMQPSTQTQKQRPGQGEWTRRRSSLAKLARRESVKLKSILKNPIRSQPQPQPANKNQAELLPQSTPKPRAAVAGPTGRTTGSSGVDANSNLGMAQPRTKTVNSVTWDSSPPREGTAPTSTTTPTDAGRRRSGTGTKLRSILKPSPSVNPELIAPVPTKPSTLLSAAMALEADKENAQPMQMPIPMQANNDQGEDYVGWRENFIKELVVAIADQPQPQPTLFENARTRLQRTRTQSTNQPLIAKESTPSPPLPPITTTTTAKETKNRMSTASGASSTTGKDILNEIDLKQLSASEARKLIRQHNRQYFQSQIWDPALAKDFAETYQIANANEGSDQQQFYQRQPPPQNLGLGAIANGINGANANANGNGKRNSYSQMLIQGTPRNSWKRTSFFRPSPPPKDDDLEKFDWRKFGSPFSSNEKRTSRDRDSRDDWGLSVRLALAKLENKIATEANNDPAKFMKARRESAQLRAWIASQRRTSESRLSKIASARQQLMSLGVTIGSGGAASGAAGTGVGNGIGAVPAGRVSAGTNATGSGGNGATNTLEQDDDAFVAELLRENEIKLKHSSNPMGEAERMFGPPNSNHHYTPFSQHPAGLATLQEEEAEGESREGDHSEKAQHLITGDAGIGAHPTVRDRQILSTSTFFRPGPLRSRAKSSVFSIFDEKKAARREGREYKSKSKFLSTATNTTNATSTTGTSTTTQSQIDQVEMQEARCCGLWKPKAFVDEISQDSDMVRK